MESVIVIQNILLFLPRARTIGALRDFQANSVKHEWIQSEHFGLDCACIEALMRTGREDVVIQKLGTLTFYVYDKDINTSSQSFLQTHE